MTPSAKLANIRTMMNEDAFITALRRRRGSKSLRQFARELGISAPYLHDVLRGSRNPGPKLLRALGLERSIERRVKYRRRVVARPADLEFHPLEISGEPLSTIILRDRR